MVERVRARFDWIQFAVLLVSVFSIGVYNEGRLSRMEQRQIDAEKDHAALVLEVQKLEAKLDSCSPHFSPSLMTP